LVLPPTSANCAWKPENYSSGCDTEVLGFESAPEEDSWSTHQVTSLRHSVAQLFPLPTSWCHVRQQSYPNAIQWDGAGRLSSEKVILKNSAAA